MNLTPTGAILIAAVALLFLFWFLGEWAYSHWGSILRWHTARRAEKRERSNPYAVAFRRGFDYGLIVGAAVVYLAWRIWK